VVEGNNLVVVGPEADSTIVADIADHRVALVGHRRSLLRTFCERWERVSGTGGSRCERGAFRFKG
jgi:hypothetical protein